MRTQPTAKPLDAWSVWFALAIFLISTSHTIAQTNGASSQKVILTEAEQAWLAKHPVVTWGIDPKWPPFSTVDKSGQVIGIDAQIVNHVAERTGLNLKLVVTTNWSETLALAAAGKIDFVGGISETEERRRQLGLEFSEVYCSFPTAIITRKDMPFLTTEKDVKTLRAALPKDYATTEELRKRFPDTPLTITTTEEESMLMVARNDADVTVLNLASAAYIVHMRGLANLKISGFTQIDFFLSLAARRDAAELLSILDKGLKSLTPQEKEGIYDEFIKPDIKNQINWKVWRKKAIYVGLSSLTLLTMALLWNRSLAREINRRKQIEAALVQARDKLEADAQALDQQSAQLKTMNENLIRANKDLESFSYSVSHDLKAPVRHIENFSELLELHTKNTLDEEGKEFLSKVRAEARRMHELIEALLRFARIGHARMKREPVNFETLTKEVIESAKFEAAGRRIEWELHSMPTVECDRELMKEVLANLVRNAVKFSRNRDPARIEIGTLPATDEGEAVIVYVKDNGAGFDPALAGTLFKSFHRLHSQQEFEGSGIGLANVSRIIERHGGRVWAEGMVDKGAKFYFSLAKRKPQETETEFTRRVEKR